jgi:hypothetical protein
MAQHPASYAGTAGNTGCNDPDRQRVVDYASIVMIEYRRVRRSFIVTALRAATVTNERSTAMFDVVYYEAVQADRDRHVAWVERHAWKHEQVREQRQHRFREAVAQVRRAFAVRFAPVDADAVGKQGRMVVEHRA